MTTVESPTVRQLWKRIEAIGSRNKRDERFSGSVGDGDHLSSPTYHRGFREVVKRFGKGAYSVTLWGDVHVPRGQQDDASAIDISSTQHSDLVTVITRMHHMAVTNPKALTNMGVREFAGPAQGGGVYAMSQVKTNKSKFVRTYGWDSSHESHIHISINRKFSRNPKILRIADFWRGL